MATMFLTATAGAVRQARPKQFRAFERQRGGDRARGERQRQLMRQHVGGAERDDAEAGGGAHQAVGDLGDGAVAAGGHDHRLAVGDRLTRQGLGVAGAVGFSQVEPHAVGDQHVEHAPQQARAPAAGDRVEHDHHERCTGAGGKLRIGQYPAVEKPPE